MRYLLLAIMVLGLFSSPAYSEEAVKKNQILAEAAPILKNLELMVDQNDYPGALKIAQDLLKKTEYSLPATHPFLGNVYNIVATLYYRQSDNDHAAYYLEKALSVECANLDTPEQISRTIDLLSSLYAKMGKHEDRLRKLKVLKASALRPMFAQPLLDKHADVYTESEMAPVRQEKTAAKPMIQTEEPPLTAPPPAETPEAQPGIQPDLTSAPVPAIEKKTLGNGGLILWGTMFSALVFVAIGLLRRRQQTLAETEEEPAVSPEQKVKTEKSFSISSPENPEPPSQVSEPAPEEKPQVQPAEEKKVSAENEIPSATDRWKQYHDRFAERQALITLGVDETVSWEEINIRYRELMQTYAPKNVEELSSELQKMAELKREKLTQAFEILRNRQTALKI